MVYITYGSLIEALYTLKSPPVVSFKSRTCPVEPSPFCGVDGDDEGSRLCCGFKAEKSLV